MALPGEMTQKQTLAQMIRVNHAGEYGAKRIYAGQLAVLKNHPKAALIRHMAQQEEVHLQAFETEIQRRHIRPTALMPLWHVAGYALGAATALMGDKAAMACTVAVESVIDAHYAEQETQLPPEEATLKEQIQTFRAEEMEHHATGLDHGAQDAPFYRVLHHAVSTATRSAIWLSKRL